jgi:glucose repression regulatory protein TUP1
MGPGGPIGGPQGSSLSLQPVPGPPGPPVPYADSYYSSRDRERDRDRLREERDRDRERERDRERDRDRDRDRANDLRDPKRIKTERMKIERPGKDVV